MVDVVTLLRRKSIKLKSKLKNNSFEHDNSVNRCISPNETVFSLDSKQESSETLINAAVNKSSRQSLESFNGPCEPLSGSHGDIRRNRSFLSNTSCKTGTNMASFKKSKLCLGRQTGSASDLVYQMNRTNWLLDEGAGTESATADRSATELKNAHDAGTVNNGEVIFVPSLSPRGSNTTLANLRYTYRSSTDIAALKRNHRHISERIRQRSRSSSASSDSSSSYLEIPRRPTLRQRKELVTVDTLLVEQATTATAMHFLVHAMNIALLIFVYMPIWIGVQVSKYTAWILAIGMAFAIFFGTCYLFIQAYTCLRYTIQNLIAIVNP